MKYDPKDYERDPGKYRLFKTARTATNLFSHNGGVNAGTVVGLEFLGDIWNQLYRRWEPVYKLTTGDVVFATALEGFVL